MRLSKWLGFFCLVVIFINFQPASAAPGDILFADNFDNGAGCGTLAPDWTVSVAANAGIGTQTSSSGSCSLFTRQGVVTVTSRAIDLSGVTGTDLTVWVRKGADTFSEDPDAGEDLAIEYLDGFGTWQGLEILSASTIADGAITNIDVSLPFFALHSGFRLRFRQAAGSGANFDFWHIDDVQLEETGNSPPGPNLTANSCDDFESGLANFTVTDSIKSGTNANTFNSSGNSLFLRHGAVTTTSISLDTSGLTEITVWIRRGSDTFSENPEGVENLVIEFRNSLGVWVALETFTGAGTQGEIFNRTYPATAAMRHANFQVRFRLTAGSGVDFDYWHVDDFCLVSAPPDVSVTKSSVVVSDPINGVNNPKTIPEAIVQYTITVTNNGPGIVDGDSISIEDVLPLDVTLFTGDLGGGGSPFVFTDGIGGNSSGLSYSFTSLGSGTDGVTFLDGASSSITPNGGFDDNVARFTIDMVGTMASATGGNTPSFTIQFQVQVD
ncbi:MAG: hypothetical protein ABJO01_16290 [Parasphingorhabdus sp.]|uniref:hypothetical protein n=1 Tax=Parasphingorhabdus sp. TaxID=2709688 RepID=UPI00329A00C8